MRRSRLSSPRQSGGSGGDHQEEPSEGTPAGTCQTTTSCYKAWMELRRIGPDDGANLRALRLAALRDSPDAFSTPYEEAVEYPGVLWQQRARAGSAGVEQATFLLFDGELACGVVTGLTQPRGGNEVLLVGMWIAPEHRRAGHGARLVGRLVGWAEEIGAPSVMLGVTSGNHPALALYRSCGFTLTGEQHPLPGRSDLVVHRMRLQLSN